MFIITIINVISKSYIKNNVLLLLLKLYAKELSVRFHLNELHFNTFLRLTIEFQTKLIEFHCPEQIPQLHFISIKPTVFNNCLINNLYTYQRRFYFDNDFLI